MNTTDRLPEEARCVFCGQPLTRSHPDALWKAPDGSWQCPNHPRAEDTRISPHTPR